MAEAIGLDAVFVADHVGFERSDGPSTEFWDGWALLPALAAVTSRIAIGPFVSPPSVRHPVALARMAAALDEVSGGRVILALGAGGAIDRAWRVLGVPTDRLYARFEETIAILAPLLREGRVDFTGEQLAAHDARIGPTGPRGGRVPIWIGVKGPRMTRVAARWADAVNFGLPLRSADDARTYVADFDDACREIGRDPATVRRTGWAFASFSEPKADPMGEKVGALRGSVGEIAAQLHAIHRAGIDHVSLYVNDGDGQSWERTFPATSIRGLERLAPVLDALRELESAGSND